MNNAVLNTCNDGIDVINGLQILFPNTFKEDKRDLSFFCELVKVIKRYQVGP